MSIVQENKRLLGRMMNIDLKPSDNQKEIIERQTNWKWKTSLNKEKRLKHLIETTKDNQVSLSSSSIELLRMLIILSV